MEQTKIARLKKRKESIGTPHGKRGGANVLLFRGSFLIRQSVHGS